ncbi:protein-glutamate methylesterase/protein-glutamine glutaminase [Bacillus sp. V33-4]|uniref:protein-glutamate methylesterase/protein-glutamine glutaminase n=1 Tax=Bacillus sp. V33-4 TaxID=2054169 RepID=UPI000C788208|nr:chemotaxis response regulator protein-glutamate methylesterase [Bacillus sp. V33-4]PLR87450.1 chemotaxis response regulator protein-glutamate methylesterase [Bacillus sp. V33-4]
MEKINVLIVDDSAFMRKLIQDFLSESPRIHIAGTARNGEDAIKKIRDLKPDVVTMDIEMPVMSGLEALQQIMKENPVPVVMLSSTTRDGAENTMLAMQYGAIDFIQKPSGSISLDLHKVKEDLIEKVLHASKANIKQAAKLSSSGNNSIHSVADYSKIELTGQDCRQSNRFSKWNQVGKKMICIGTSTGGPRALQQVLTRLPARIAAPILIVQHMPAGFTKSLASRLDSLSEIQVKEAEAGEIIRNGVAYIAPGGYHLKIKAVGTSLAVQLDQTAPHGGHRPSVDVLFESVSHITDYSKVAVIMTGMGSDGSMGLAALKKHGTVKAIAESQETSIVFGMPKAAIATKLVDEVQSIENIAETIMKYV